MPAVFAFDLHGTGDAEADFARVAQFVDALRLVRLVANIGDARSLVSHPASMTHSHLTPTQLAANFPIVQDDPAGAARG